MGVPRCLVERWLREVRAGPRAGSLRGWTWARLHERKGVGLHEVVEAVQAVAAARRAYAPPQALLRCAEGFMRRYDDGRDTSSAREAVVRGVAAFADLSHYPAPLIPHAHRAAVQPALLSHATHAQLLCAVYGWMYRKPGSDVAAHCIATRSAVFTPGPQEQASHEHRLRLLTLAKVVAAHMAEGAAAAPCSIEDFCRETAALLAALSLGVASAPYVRAAVRRLASVPMDVFGAPDAGSERAVGTLVALELLVRQHGQAWDEEYGIATDTVATRVAAAAGMLAGQVSRRPSTVAGVSTDVLLQFFERFPEAVPLKVVVAALRGRKAAALPVRFLVARARGGHLADPVLLQKVVDAAVKMRDATLVGDALVVALPRTPLGRDAAHFEARFVDALGPYLPRETATVALAATTRFRATPGALKLAKIAVGAARDGDAPPSQGWLRDVLHSFSTIRIRPRSYIESDIPRIMALYSPKDFGASALVDVVTACAALRVDLTHMSELE